MDDCKDALDALDNPKAHCMIDDDYIRYTENGIRQKHFFQYNNHAIGNIVSAKFLSDNEKDHKYFIKHLSDLIREFDELPIDKTISQYADFDALDNRLGKVLIKK